MKLASLFLLLCCALAPGCKVVDIRTDASHAGVAYDGFLRGYVTHGWSDQDSLLQIQLLGGRSRGTIIEIELWKLARIELGLLGVSAGIGPLNAGIGVLAYHPVPPFGPDQPHGLPMHDPLPPTPPSPPVDPLPPAPPVPPVQSAMDVPASRTAVARSS